jgi:D-alanine-D-alanine ligase
MNAKSGGEKPPQGSKNGDRKVIVLGPVSDLEEHVHPDWWRRIFNSLYLKTDSDVVDDPSITRQEVDLFADALQVDLQARILDLCCGQGRHSMELARRGYANIEGLDRSHYLIQRAKAAAKKEGLSVKFREGDARKLPYPPDSFDAVIILGNSFGYFDTVLDDLRVLREVLRALKPWGKLLIDVADGEFLRQNYQARSWEWMDARHFVCRERKISADGNRLISREVISHVNKGVIADQFYAERLYSQESLTELLKITGAASEPVFQGQISPDSKRNQDLGMMAQRIILTTTARKEWTPVKRKAREVERHIAVVMGDPSKPDPLKPDMVFDDDDFYTIDRLKEELRDLKGYRPIYVTNHDTIFQDLRRLTGRVDLVLNLCDEGYRNDPRKELHVPALLEALELPYTGAGPQCLAHCYDKSLVRGVAVEMNIPVPGAIFVKGEDSTYEFPFEFPVIVKPNFGDSSFGITQNSVCYTIEALVNAISEIREKFGYEKPVLVEEFLTGKDLSLGIIGNPPESYQVLPIIEEDYSALPEGLPRICGYEAKWKPDSPYWKLTSIPAELPDDTARMLILWSLKLFERLECRDYARFDWRLDGKEEPRLLEVNPNPGWCWDGHLAKMAKVAGMTYGEMLANIIHAAEARMKLSPVTPRTEGEMETRAEGEQGTTELKREMMVEGAELNG